MAEPWLICFFACNREMQPFSFFFVIRCGGISGRVRALNLTVPLGSGQTISGTGRVRASVLSPCRPLHRTCMEKFFSSGFTHTLPEWRYLPLQVGCFSLTHTSGPVWKGWVLSWGSVRRLSTVWNGTRVQRWVRFPAKQTREGHRVCCIDRNSHRITLASVFVSLSNVKD